jgi:hypothetical protein
VKDGDRGAAGLRAVLDPTLTSEKMSSMRSTDSSDLEGDDERLAIRPAAD